VELDTILHKGKDLAPTPLWGRDPDCNIGTVSAGLNRVVSVRTYILLYVGVTHYRAP